MYSAAPRAHGHELLGTLSDTLKSPSLRPAPLHPWNALPFVPVLFHLRAVALFG
ncbi:hypothetical protein BaRGS_00016133, partial [Batillaria attramentaria]